MKNKIKKIKNIDTIYLQGLCTQCGACYGFCPKDNIRIDRASNRDYVFRVKDERLCDGCGICYKVCSGHTVDFKKLNQEVFKKDNSDSLLGNFNKCYIAQANNANIRKKGASGGVVSALLEFALLNKLIDSAIVVRMNKDNPLEPEVFEAKTEKEIHQAAQSKYCPVPMDIGLRDILKKPGKFAIVGLPCHIHAIRNAEAMFPGLKEKIVYQFGLFCGPGPSFLMTDHLLKKLKVKAEEVRELKYRDGDCWPGGLFVRTKTKGEKKFPLMNYLYAQTLFNKYRCALCADFAAEFSDFSFGDAHFPAFRKGAQSLDINGRKIIAKQGWNMVVCRSKSGKNLLDKAVEKKVIELIDIDAKQVIIAQRSMLQYKKTTVFVLRNFIKIYGKKLPLYIGIKPGKAGMHDYFKCFIVMLSQLIMNTGFLRFIIARAPQKLLTYKIRFRQKKLNDFTKDSR